MPGLPKVYRTRAERVLSSFDFVDILTGKAIQKFYLGTSKDDEFLNDQVFYSHFTGLISSTGSGTFTKVLDKDFDITISKPLIVYGNFILNLGMGLKGNNTSGQDYYFYILAKIRKYNGSTENELVEVSGATLIQLNATGNQVKTETEVIEGTIPKTKFSVGDVLRVTIEGWAKTTGGLTGNFYFSCDPKNRSAITGWDNTNISWGETPTEAFIYIPLVIDL